MCSGVSLGSACCQSLALVENAQQLTVDEFSGIGGGIGDEVLKNEKRATIVPVRPCRKGALLVEFALPGVK